MPLPDGHKMTADRYVSLFKEAEKHTFAHIEAFPEQDNVDLEPIKLNQDSNIKVGIKIGGPVVIPMRDGGWLLLTEPEEAEQFNELWPEIEDKWKLQSERAEQGRTEEAAQS